MEFNCDEDKKDWQKEIELAIRMMKKREEIKRRMEERKKRSTVSYEYFTPKNTRLIVPKKTRSYLKPYFVMVKETKRDFTKLAENKRLERHPVSFMGRGLLGYTILGCNYMVVRDDLEGEKKEMVELHESIHTPDEYETRVITDWMLSDDDGTNYQVKYTWKESE